MKMNKDVRCLYITMIYVENNNIAQWVQEFLRGTGENPALADGILL